MDSVDQMDRGYAVSRSSSNSIMANMELTVATGETAAHTLTDTAAQHSVATIPNAG